MFSAGTQGRGDLSSSQSNVTIEQRIQRWVDLVERGASYEQIQQAEIEVAEVLRRQPFELKQRLPFFQKLAQRLDARQAFQQFRLPGKDRVVVDRRDQFEGKPAQPDAKQQGAKEGAKEAQREATREARENLRLQEGKLVREKGRKYANFLGDRADLGRGGLDRQAAADRVEKLLSAFERMIVARFEEGEQIARETPEGKARFAAKSAAEWKAFFQNFLSRTVKKRVLLSQIRDFLFRGAVTKGGKGVFIGDMHLAGGRVEKFVRFSLLAEALAQLKNMVPGDRIGKGILANLTGEELVYLALAASRGRQMQFAQEAAQGRFMGGRAEAQAAEALGIPLDDQLRQKARQLRGRRGKGFFAGDLLGEHVPGEEAPTRFIPWWHWGNLFWPQKRRWATIVFYLALLAVALIGIAAMTMRWLGG